jgi:hypothetical protein
MSKVGVDGTSPRLEPQNTANAANGEGAFGEPGLTVSRDCGSVDRLRFCRAVSLRHDSKRTRAGLPTPGTLVGSWIAANQEAVIAPVGRSMVRHCEACGMCLSLPLWDRVDGGEGGQRRRCMSRRLLLARSPLIVAEYGLGQSSRASVFGRRAGGAAGAAVGDACRGMMDTGEWIAASATKTLDRVLCRHAGEGA